MKATALILLLFVLLFVLLFPTGCGRSPNPLGFRSSAAEAEITICADGAEFPATLKLGATGENERNITLTFKAPSPLAGAVVTVTGGRASVSYPGLDTCPYDAAARAFLSAAFPFSPGGSVTSVTSGVENREAVTRVTVLDGGEGYVFTLGRDGLPVKLEYGGICVKISSFRVLPS